MTRGRSVILEDYKDEIATSKHKAAKTLVHKMQWVPYGERPSSNEVRHAYDARSRACSRASWMAPRPPACPCSRYAWLRSDC